MYVEEKRSMIRLVDKEWGKEISDALCTDASELRIICPFIKKGAIEQILEHSFNTIQVITRFNLADFAEGVSDITALRELLDAGAGIRGIRNLHAKIYLFGDRRAIITSANLTKAALERNHEFGLVAEDESLIKACRDYFGKLWNNGGKNLTSKQLHKWDKEIAFHIHTQDKLSKVRRLNDFGANINIPVSPIDRISHAKSFKIPPAVANASQAFVKFLGTGEKRVELNYPIIDEIKYSGCHHFLSYPTSKRPVRIKGGDVMFISRTTKDISRPTKDQDDHRIFGLAIATRHRKGQDEATKEDIKHRSWRKKYNVYVRVDEEGFEAEFLAGKMENGVSLNELMDTLKSDSFVPTQRNALAGKGNIDPRKSIRRQAHIQLSEEARAWLTEKLQEAFAKHGKITASDIEESD